MFFRGIQAVGLLVLCAIFLLPCHAAERPNFVVLLADDLGYGDLGVYGNTLIKTPHLDRMAAEGVRLTEFYTPAPSCSPARISLLTGRYPRRSGLVRVLIPLEKWGIPASELTLAEVLGAQGYRSAMIGKWHLGSRRPYRPLKHGFDEFYGVLYSNDMAKIPVFKYPPFKLFDGEKPVESPAVRKNLTRNYTERAREFIRANRDQPFFLYLAYTMPHRPPSPSDEFRGRSAHGLYGDTVEEIDWSVGEILAEIRDLGIDQETFVIFTSDNGPWVRGAYMKKIKGGSTGGLRGGKGTTWEGGMRVPMIARWPGRIPAGEVRGGIASLLDIFPTLTLLSGARLPDDRVIDGRDILPFLAGEAPSPHRDFFYYFRTHLFAIRSGQWKLHLYRRDPEGKQQQLKKPERCDPPLLYNLVNDPAESADVAAEHPEVVVRLTKLGAEFDGAIEPVMSLPPPSKSLRQGLTTGAPKDPNKVPHAKQKKK